MSIRRIPASGISMGDTVEVNLGMGSVMKIVDEISHTGEMVKITLFNESGKRPVVTLHKNYFVNVYEPDKKTTQTNAPSNCPNCNGQREWRVEGKSASCFFCGLTTKG